MRLSRLTIDRASQRLGLERASLMPTQMTAAGMNSIGASNPWRPELKDARIAARLVCICRKTCRAECPAASGNSVGPVSAIMRRARSISTTNTPPKRQQIPASNIFQLSRGLSRPASRRLTKGSRIIQTAINSPLSRLRMATENSPTNQYHERCSMTKIVKAKKITSPIIIPRVEPWWGQQTAESRLQPNKG